MDNRIETDEEVAKSQVESKEIWGGSEQAINLILGEVEIIYADR